MKFSQFKNKNVLIMGLGMLGGGVGAARFFCDAGANVTVTDLKKKRELKKAVAELKKYDVKYVLGGHCEKDFKDADLIIKGPSVRDDSRYLKIAKKNDVKIDTDVGIFFQYCPCQIIGVTGTKGKSTIVTLIYKLLKSKNKKTFLGGNIQKSVLDILPKLDKNSLAVLELSSWQLEGLVRHKKSPQVALITNIFPDHLNTYRNFAAYREAKKIIFKYQTSKDILVLNNDDKELCKITQNHARFALASARRAESRGNRKIKSRIKLYSVDPLPRVVAKIKNDSIFYKNKCICSISELKVPGEHNLRHILGAITVMDGFNVPISNIRKTIISFKGVSGRLEFVKKINGVKYFNDTTATNPSSVVVALNTLGRASKNIILIIGGVDKNFNSNIYEKLARRINCSVKHLVLLPGSATEKIKKAIKLSKVIIPATEVNSMKRAVAEASHNALEGEIVILSPGGSSFNLFRNEFDRGEQFVRAVKKL